jgi:thiamine monophosphate synthase
VATGHDPRPRRLTAALAVLHERRAALLYAMDGAASAKKAKAAVTAGAWGVAAIRGLFDVEDPPAAASALVRAAEEAAGSSRP